MKMDITKAKDYRDVPFLLFESESKRKLAKKKRALRRAYFGFYASVAWSVAVGVGLVPVFVI